MTFTNNRAVLYYVANVVQTSIGLHINRLFGSIFGKRDLLASDHIMLPLFWSYVPNMK